MSTLHTSVRYRRLIMTSSVCLLLVSLFTDTYDWVTISVLTVCAVGLLLFLFLPRKKARYENHGCSSPESIQFIQLMKLSIDTSTEILRSFADTRLLNSYGGSFTSFLNNKKHYFYHQWEPHLFCCECPAAGCTIPKSKSLPNWLFQKMYVKMSEPVGGHLKIKKGNIVEHCLHVYTAASDICLESLDITALSLFLRHCGSMSAQESSSVNEIVSIRNKLCHVNKTDNFTSLELQKMRQNLENTIFVLVQPAYRNLVKEQIKLVTKIEFGFDEIGILHKKVEQIKESIEVIEENSCKVGALAKSVKQLETNIINNTRKERLALQSDIQEQNAEVLKYLKNSDNKLALYFGKLHKRIRDIETKINICACSKVPTEEEVDDTREREIDMVCEIPSGQVDEDEIVRKLDEKRNMKTEGRFTITSVMKKCVVILLTTSSDIVNDEDKLEKALDELVMAIVQAANNDNLIQQPIRINLIFQTPLKTDELDILNSILAEITYSNEIDEQSAESDESLYSEEEMQVVWPNKVYSSEDQDYSITVSKGKDLTDVGVQVDLLSVLYLNKITSDNKTLKKELTEKSKALKELRKELRKFQAKRHKKEKRKRPKGDFTFAYQSGYGSFKEDIRKRYASEKLGRSNSVPRNLQDPCSRTTSESESYYILRATSSLNTSEAERIQEHIHVLDTRDSDTESSV